MTKKRLLRPVHWIILLLVSSIFLLIGIGVGIKLKNKKQISHNSKNGQKDHKKEIEKLQKQIKELEAKQNQSQSDKEQIARLKRELEELKKKFPINPPFTPQNGRFRALVPTKKEREYQKGEGGVPLPISSVNCGTCDPEYFSYEEGKLVVGVALLTDTLDGSGNGSSVLNDKGITHIIHASNQPYSSFNNNEEMFIDYVVKSVQNSILLADRNNFEKLAIPLVGGGIFLGDCDPKKLGEGIIKGAVNQLAECQKLRQVIFLDWHDNKTPRQNRQVFLTAFSKLQDEGWFGKHLGGSAIEVAKNPAKSVVFEEGDIRDKDLHKASVIVNAANTQIKFGGGVSGAIAEQVGDKNKIEQKAQELISKFNT